jgi:archaellum component FlaF (FlaF/FlaG flagellin family)
MNIIIILITVLVSFGGLYISINTIIETRKKYYTDYLKRKKNEET